MKQCRFVLVFLSLLLAACGSITAGGSGGTSGTLRVTDGTKEASYSVADLERLAAGKATLNGVAYEGVALLALLRDAGFDAGELKAVKAVAADGYSVNYDPALFQRQDVLVAYGTEAGPLAEEDGLLRLVVPGEEGKLNLRMLVELRVTP